ncbi:hypothetical protein NM688_g2388 [Phlebia brevispora]|uniref:Uncharacterized protein n=1 Tax=Phlebia brevispora TaxID=194682 RepID=A0ACC1T8X7_9APHY|nr:hypothetical protein NM688_g2388 [Phlebia brevispora]
MSQSDPSESYDGLNVMYKTYLLTFQTLFFGVYMVLIPFSAHILLKRGLRTRTNFILLASIFTPFITSAAYWVVSIADQIERMRTYFVDRSLRDSTTILSYATLFNALIFVNYIFGDGVVVWRAYTLCREDYRKTLIIPTIFLVLTTLFVFGTIGLRIGTYFTAAGVGGTLADPVKFTLNVFQVATLVWSLLTNCSATGIISHKAWRHRQAVRDGIRNARNRSVQAERILVLLIETGAVYLASSLLLLVLMFIRLPYGTIGDIYTPCNLQVAGIYPTLVIVLVGLQQTLKETNFWSANEPTVHTNAMPGHQVSHIRFVSRHSTASDRSDEWADERHRDIANNKSEEEV